MRGTKIRASIAVVCVTTMSILPYAARGSDKVELTYWTMLDHSSRDARAQTEREILKRFMQENPNISVKVDTTPWNKLPQKTILAVQSGGGPDVSRVSFGQTLEYINLNTLQPLDPYLQGDERTGLLGESTVFDGKRMAIVYTPVPNAILYRKDLFAATGLPEPKTWDDFSKVAAAMTKDRVHGFGIGLSPAKSLVPNFVQPYIWGAGGKIFEGACGAWDGPAGVKSVQFLLDMMNVHKAMPSDVLRLTNDDVLDGFRAGRFASVVEEASRASTAASSDITKGKVGLWRFPSDSSAKGSPPHIYSWSIGVSSASKHPQEAARLVKFMTAAAADHIKAETSGELPARASSLAGIKFNPANAAVSEAFVTYLADFEGSPQVYPKNPAKFHDLVIQAIQQVAVEKVPVQKALTDSVAAYDRAVGCR
ncbi:ABC transporter substrate-binding protein [uncultured Enterovirga sp.]|uniref:ABC transporter substrate-binding protein n=1 Tax=uncultured Enterovirga sp. TaxID=2026352 RepID=UPI0035CB5964